MRKAMGLMQAIMIILIVSGMMVIVLKYASISSRHVADTYIKEQNALFLQSAIEQTLLQISNYDRTTNNDCLVSPSITAKTKRGLTYSATVTIKRYYLQNGSVDLSDCGSPLGVGIKPSTNQSHGMVLLEVESTAKKGTTIVSRILKRTLQQP